MFSAEDVRELFQDFPPQKSAPTLLLASSGLGFVTQEKLQNEFEHRLTEATGRISVLNLAHDLDVQPEVLLDWVRHSDQRAVLSKDSKEVVSKAELNVITQSLRRSLETGIVSKIDYEASTHVDFGNLRPMLHEMASDLVYHDDYVCTQQYEKLLSEHAKDFLERSINNITNIDLRPRDLHELQGSPPRWLFLRWIQQYADSGEYKERVFVRDMPDFIRVQPTEMRAHTISTLSRPLVSGDVAYIDLKAVMERSIFHDDIAGIAKDFNDIEGIEVVDYFAISETWLSKFIDQKLRALHYQEVGLVDVAQGLTTKFRDSVDVNLHTTYENHRTFPEQLSAHIEHKAEQCLATASSNTNYHQFGTAVLTDEQYAKEQNHFLERAAEDANSQWQQLKSDPSHELKFAIADITSESNLHSSLAKEKTTQKACDEHFWNTISSLEASSDAAFSTFWLERVASRIQIYASGLAPIADPKLQSQLSELLATYIQKELIPDSITKARSQHLVQSRKAKKNIAKLETTIAGAEPTLGALLPALDKFLTKQTSLSVSDAELAKCKTSMQADMIRRMQKSAAGPVLFLTLIVVLFSRHHDGVVYATGKFAPKLMKQLKARVGEEGYKRLEGWKEGAKAGSLGEGDRVEMRRVAEEGAMGEIEDLKEE
ncbi:hypothetical protein DE146DRAFT_744022 [Phaeosphaeria sp. MPI-PUGE-AT-0046c]|nr:hypothetical protein DE146DRAFT_744022 [Phaeosphaeria sp. MPI-PUGE-AT-0046c]